MHIETQRLIITNFDLSMAEDVHKNSLDEDNRRFVPDEVFETVSDAQDTIEFLMGAYETEEGPFVHPILLKDGTNIGYVQLAPVGDEFEVGYHIAKAHTGHGYATEALTAFLQKMLPEKNQKSVWGICVIENAASIRVLEKAGFRKEYEGPGEYQGATRPIVKYLFTA